MEQPTPLGKRDSTELTSTHSKTKEKAYLAEAGEDLHVGVGVGQEEAPLDDAVVAAREVVRDVLDGVGAVGAAHVDLQGGQLDVLALVREEVGEDVEHGARLVHQLLKARARRLPNVLHRSLCGCVRKGKRRMIRVREMYTRESKFAVERRPHDKAQRDVH